MHRRTTRGNRLGLALTGTVLVLAGAALLALRYGVFGDAARRSSVYPADVRRYVHDQGSWLWPSVTAVAVLVGLAFLRWLAVQGRTDRLRGISVDTDDVIGADDVSGPGIAVDAGRAGRTRMPADALTDVVEDDVAALRGVRRVSAALSGHSDAPQLWLRVITDANANVGRIRRAILDEVVPDARACLEVPNLPTYVRLYVSRRDGGREVL